MYNGFIVGVMALYTGLILWRLFVRLDSPRHPSGHTEILRSVSMAVLPTRLLACYKVSSLL